MKHHDCYTNQQGRMPCTCGQMCQRNTDGSDPGINADVTMSEAVKWFVIALFLVTMAAWLGLAAGYWTA